MPAKSSKRRSNGPEPSSTRYPAHRVNHSPTPSNTLVPESDLLEHSSTFPNVGSSDERSGNSRQPQSDSPVPGRYGQGSLVESALAAPASQCIASPNAATYGTHRLTGNAPINAETNGMSTAIADSMHRHVGYNHARRPEHSYLNNNRFAQPSEQIEEFIDGLPLVGYPVLRGEYLQQAIDDVGRVFPNGY